MHPVPLALDLLALVQALLALRVEQNRSVVGCSNALDGDSQLRGDAQVEKDAGPSSVTHD